MYLMTTEQIERFDRRIIKGVKKIEEVTEGVKTDCVEQQTLINVLNKWAKEWIAGEYKMHTAIKLESGEERIVSVYDAVHYIVFDTSGSWPLFSAAGSFVTALHMNNLEQAKRDPINLAYARACVEELERMFKEVK